MFESESPLFMHEPRVMSEPVRLGEILPAVLIDLENRMLAADENTNFAKVVPWLQVANFQSCPCEGRPQRLQILFLYRPSTYTQVYLVR